MFDFMIIIEPFLFYNVTSFHIMQINTLPDQRHKSSISTCSNRGLVIGTCTFECEFLKVRVLDVRFPPNRDNSQTFSKTNLLGLEICFSDFKEFHVHGEPVYDMPVCRT